MKALSGRICRLGGRRTLTILGVVCIIAVVVVASSAVAFTPDSSSNPQPFDSSATSVATSTAETPGIVLVAKDESQGEGVSDEYPDRTPNPEPVNTQQALHLGQLSLATVAGAGLKLVDSSEISYPDTTVTRIVLGPAAADQGGIVVIAIFKDPSMGPASSEMGEDAFGTLEGRAADRDGSSVQRIVVPGAVDACVITNNLLAGCQALAYLPDQTVVNICSEGSGVGGQAPLDRPAVERLLAAIVEEL
jgi:hypothetical protein